MHIEVDIIVPVRDDTVALAALLGRISTWKRPPRRVIVAAADADDALGALCAANDGRGFQCRLLRAAPGRGAQLDTGARTAGDGLDSRAGTTPRTVLWFLHADAAPAAGSIEAIESAVACGAESGCFRFAFEGPAGFKKRLIERLVALRVRLGGTAYGDQGIFATREAYLAAGGFPHQPLFEEVSLERNLRRRGTFRPLPLELPVSTRRWERDGWWRRTLKNRWLAMCYMFGVSPRRLSSRYERRPLRERSSDGSDATWDPQARRAAARSHVAPQESERADTSAGHEQMGTRT